jgi:hypothetical protein
MIEDHPLHHTYKEDPPNRPNGRAKARTTKDQSLGPPASQSEKGAPGGAPPGVSRTPGLAEPKRVPVLPFDVEKRLLFLIPMAKVSVQRNGGNRPWRL